MCSKFLGNPRANCKSRCPTMATMLRLLSQFFGERKKNIVRIEFSTIHVKSIHYRYIYYIYFGHSGDILISDISLIVVLLQL